MATPASADNHASSDCGPSSLPPHALLEEFPELKATHAPLLSAAYFLQAYCRDYNDDFMLCKRDKSMEPSRCALEGRKVTRCALDLFRQLETRCGESFERHWRCLESNNNYFWKCRSQEKTFNQCVFQHLGLKKTIPGAPDYEVPVHMRSDRDRWYQ